MGSNSDWLPGDVIANGIKIHYYRTGGDKPPFVLAHGFSDIRALCPGGHQIPGRGISISIGL